MDSGPLTSEAHRESLARLRETLERSQSALRDLERDERQHHRDLIAARRRLDPASQAEAFWNGVEFKGNQQRFLVCRQGSSGSAYLAKLIGAHPEVFCSHEGILANRVPSAVSHSEREQQVFLAYVCSDTLHHAYQASGDVGSAWLGYLLLAPKHCSAGGTGPALRTGVLRRHPLRVLKTQLHIAARAEAALPADANADMANYFADAAIDCDVENIHDAESRSFVWTCYQWRRSALDGKLLDVQIHVEELNDLEYAQERLRALTGVEYDAALLSPLLGKVVNSRTGEAESLEAIYARFPPPHQRWYDAIVKDVASSVGYSMRTGISTIAPAKAVIVRSNRLENEALPERARIEQVQTLDRILFIGYCWGSAGTAWLAKLLNAHPDICCLHAPIFPRFNHSALKDSLEIIDSLFHRKALGQPYSYVGLTHGVSLEWHSHFVKHFERVRGFITTRHPIPRIHSTFSHNMIPRVAEAKQADADLISNLMTYHDRLEMLSGKTFPKDYEALSFYHGCGMVNAIVSEAASGLPLFKYEELTTDYRMVQQVLKTISDDRLDMDQSLIERIQQTPVNTRAGKVENRSPRSVYESWNEVQREAFHWLVTKESIELYRKAGYELDPSW